MILDREHVSNLDNPPDYSDLRDTALAYLDRAETAERERDARLTPEQLDATLAHLRGSCAAAEQRAEQGEDACGEMRAALEAAVAIIRTWHGIGMGDLEPGAWAIYEKYAPEMKPIFAAMCPASSPGRSPLPSACSPAKGATDGRLRR